MKKLDYSKLQFAPEPVSSVDALKDITPFEWPDSVLNGEDQPVYVCVPKQEKERNYAVCKRGDIIVIKSYRARGDRIGKHSFVVVDDEGGTVRGIPFDFAALVMSSFKDAEQRTKKLSYPGNVEIGPKDTKMGANANKKSGFVKTDQFYYFDKSKTDFRVIGTFAPDAFEYLLYCIEDLAKQGITIEQIIDNLFDEE